MINDLETMEVLEAAVAALARLGADAGAVEVEHAPELVEQWLDDLVDPDDLAEIRAEEGDWLDAEIGVVVERAELAAAELLEAEAADAEVWAEEEAEEEDGDGW